MFLVLKAAWLNYLVQGGQLYLTFPFEMFSVLKAAGLN